MTLVRSVAMAMFDLGSVDDDVHERVWLREAPRFRRALQSQISAHGFMPVALVTYSGSCVLQVFGSWL